MYSASVVPLAVIQSGQPWRYDRLSAAFGRSQIVLVFVWSTGFRGRGRKHLSQKLRYFVPLDVFFLVGVFLAVAVFFAARRGGLAGADGGANAAESIW